MMKVKKKMVEDFAAISEHYIINAVVTVTVMGKRREVFGAVSI